MPTTKSNRSGPEWPDWYGEERAAKAAALRGRGVPSLLWIVFFWFVSR
jgi:hypothetical protein